MKNEKQKAFTAVVKAQRSAEYKLASVIAKQDRYYDRTGIRRNSYSRRGQELSHEAMDARKALAEAIGFRGAFEFQANAAEQMVADAIWKQFTEFARAKAEYREAFSNNPLCPATIEAARLMGEAYAAYRMAIMDAIKKHQELIGLPKPEAVAEKDDKRKENVPCPVCGAKCASSPDANGHVGPCGE